MIGARITTVVSLLQRIQQYETIIETDDFEPATIDDMQSNAKDICNEVKAEVDLIKAEIGHWG